MAHANRKTILIVEDNLAMNEAITDILDMNGYRVLSAGDGVDGLALMQEERPDIVLCDIMMPRMDGHTLLQYARSDETLRTVPFVFLTARSSAQDKRLAKSIGIDDYLVKPVDTEDLLLAVSNVLRREDNIRAQTEHQIDRLRSQIISALQHEFRTPLTFILGYAELLADGASETLDVETLRTSTAAIMEGAHRLQSMIEKFLFLADMQYRRELPGPIGLVNCIDLMATAVQAHASTAEDVGLRLSLDCDLDEPTILADPVYLRSAIDQLIENAIQYRRPDSSHIQLSIFAAGGYLALRVSDDGRGISADDLALLQNPFVQIDRDNRAVPGMGLGLALVNHITRLHGGSIQIESKKGKGSTFTLWLPTPPKGD